MIDRDEIEVTSKLLGVRTSDVQRDYLYGWLLAGVYGDNPLMRDRLVLKGGNAFRKGYFVNTRFSGDLDFAAPAGLHPVQLLDALNYACRMVQGRTGVEFDLDRNAQTGQRSIDSTKTLHKFTLYFKDFYGKASTMTIALRMDVTEFGRLYLPIQQRKLIHPYSDQADCATTLEVVSLEEALADKLKCLLQRHMSNDLFDLVYSIFVNNDIAVDKTKIVTTFLPRRSLSPARRPPSDCCWPCHSRSCAATGARSSAPRRAGWISPWRWTGSRASCGRCSRRSGTVTPISPPSSRRRGGPDAAERLVVSADAHLVRRQRPRCPRPPQLRPHHERRALSSGTPFTACGASCRVMPGLVAS